MILIQPAAEPVVEVFSEAGREGIWQSAITRYLPSAAGQAVIGRTRFAPPGQLLTPWAGFALFCAYTAAVLIAAALTLTRRDA